MLIVQKFNIFCFTVSRETAYICNKKFFIMDTETLNIFTNIFSNVCFPVAACIALFWFLVKQNKELKNAVDNNTKVLTELKTIIQK